MKAKTELQNRLLYVSLFCMMAISFFVGFLHPFLSSHNLNVHRLHVFLFNLCAGGVLLLRYSVPSRNSSIHWLFFIIAIIFTISAALSRYLLAIASALVCAVIVEKVRLSRFPFFPVDFFRKGVPVSEKFHHAALLCLSIALLASAFSMIARLRGIPLPPKMTIDIFFLGFSFPVSLITMSLLFSNIQNSSKGSESFLSQFVFWAVNIGVIVFFVFILVGWVYSQITIAALLFVSVGIMLWSFITWYNRDSSFQMFFSGMMFFLISAISGLAYIVVKYSYFGSSSHLQKYLLELHRYVSLYGWNQVGMLLLLQKNCFRIPRLNSASLICHWLAILLFAPLAFFCPLFGLLASILYAAFLVIAVWKRGDESNSSQEPFFHR